MVVQGQLVQPLFALVTYMIFLPNWQRNLKNLGGEESKSDKKFLEVGVGWGGIKENDFF